MFSIDQHCSDYLHIQKAKKSPDFEDIDGQNQNQESRYETRITNKSSKSVVGMMRKKKSMYSFDACCVTEAPSFSGASSIGESSDSSFDGDYGTTPVTPTTLLPLTPTRNFIDDMKQLIVDAGSSNNDDVESYRQLNLSNAVARKVMEPHLRRARLLREKSRGPISHGNISASIASSMGVPYMPLRRECPFLFDISTYSLHTVLAQTLGTNDLSQIHLHSNDGDVLLPLLNERNRTSFHSVYDAFVTSFCIPLLHSMAISKGVIHQSSSDRVHYRYQAFPNVHVARPGESVYNDPTCDSILGYSVGCLTFYIPLTPCAGSKNNCLLVESHPGREDWHALGTKSIGLGYLFDGTRCLQFDVTNTSANTRVAMMFRVIIYRDDIACDSTNASSATGLCPRDLLVDAYSKNGNSTFYDEAYIDLRSAHAVVKKHGSRLLEPSPYLGHPFA
jgi:hypothetical protein